MSPQAPLVSGVAVIRNGNRLDYPFVESIRSVLPICDEFIAVVGKSTDDTLECIQELGDAVRIVETEWSDHVEPRKCLIAQQANIGMHLSRGAWCIHLQSNEVLHEDDLPKLRALMETHADSRNVEGILTERLTFWADYDHVLTCYPDRFKYTPRIVRPHIGTYAVHDGMRMAVFDGFSTRGRPPRCVDSGVDLYRYGLVRSNSSFGTKFSEAAHMDGSGEIGDYLHTRYAAPMIADFHGTHPKEMHARVEATPPRYARNDPRSRSAPTTSERRRLIETGLYRRFGFPRWRDSRYVLEGDWVAKPRATDRSEPPN